MNNHTHLNKYIHQIYNTLSNEFCKNVIDMFEIDENKYKGITKGGQDDKIKKTTDLKINNDIAIYEPWYKTKMALEIILKSEFKKYMEINKIIFPYNNFSYQVFLIQKYNKNDGKYIYHNDFDYEDKLIYRVATFIWYLNTIDEGGETEFFGDYKIKPECGKMVFFPAEWFFPHSGLMPISHDKYIITGWLYYS